MAAKPRRVIRITLISILGVLIVVTGWVGIRTALAVGEIQSAIPLASEARDVILSGDPGSAPAIVDELMSHTSAASSLTSDPVFRVVEVVPGIGPNLTAFRQSAAATDDLAVGLAPLADLAGGLSAEALAPVDGRFDIEALAEVAPTLGTAERAISRVRADVQLIDTSRTVEQIADAVERLSTTTDEVSAQVSALSHASQLLPSMLGAEGDRKYLLIFQNNAEIRSSGGIPGALALLTTSDGRFEMTTQSTAQAFPYFDAPVGPVDFETESLYGSDVGRRMQNVNLTPDFPASAAYAAEMWRLQYGDELDGVMAVDPVMLGYLLKATGPVDLGVGGQLTSANAVDFLLSDVYREFPDNESQDAVFAAVARAVFGSLSSGTFDTPTLLAQLERGSEERRFLLWNARPGEQALVAGSDFAGELPRSNAGATVLGVFLNDVTGAKLDYYFDAASTVTVDRCGEEPKYEVSVRISSSVPLDAVTSLSPTTLGPGIYGVPLGTIRTRVSVYGPVGSILRDAVVDDKAGTAQSAEHLNRPVAQVIVDLAPGESRTITVDFQGAADASERTDLRMTPLLRAFEGESLAIDCG